MSILKSTNSGAKAIPLKDEQIILDEIAKLGYTYNYSANCWSCSKNSLPDIIISHLYGMLSFSIYVDFSSNRTTTYHIKTMYDLFNFIEDIKNNYVNS